MILPFLESIGLVRRNFAELKASHERTAARLQFWMDEAHDLQKQLDDALDRLEAAELSKRKRESLRPRPVRVKRKTDLQTC